MPPFRLALLASCVALPAMAQTSPSVPMLDNGHAVAQASAQASAQVALSQAQADQDAARMRAQQAGAPGGQGSVPTTMPPKIDPVSPNRPLTKKEIVNVSVAAAWVARFQKPQLDDDGVEHFAAGRGEIQVVTAVDHVTDIALAPGEIVAPPLHFGDQHSWWGHVAASGSGRNVISHILIKPTDAGLLSNLVVETNKRSISIALKSQRPETIFMSRVALDLPEDQTPAGEWAAYDAAVHGGNQPGAGAVSSPCDQSPAVPPAQFTIDGPNVTWRPVQVYEVTTQVGTKMCIDFPSDIGSRDLPALLALADDGGWFTAASKQIVNVRFVNRRFVVDEELPRFVLIDGVGSQQKIVTVTRKSQ
jgi:type IV secretion system protein TrbG